MTCGAISKVASLQWMASGSSPPCQPTKSLKEGVRAADEALDRDGAGRAVVLGDDGQPPTSASAKMEGRPGVDLICAGVSAGWPNEPVLRVGLRRRSRNLR